MDIVYVTYNSSKWIENCFDSIRKLNYDISKLKIWVVDNASTDDTLEKLANAKIDIECMVDKFEIIQSKENLGFGKANNLGFSKGEDDIVCFFNIDTELQENALLKLEEDIANSIENNTEVAVWELRQFPYEHPKMYDPVTMETSWCSGAAFAVKRYVFQQVNGFDDQLFMYAEDVDLSWRIRSYGYKLKYSPRAIIYHYSYENAGEIKPNQYINGIINNVMLRYRFGNPVIVLIGYLGVLKDIVRPEVYAGARKQLYEAFLRHFSKIGCFKKSRELGPVGKKVATFNRFSYSENRGGAFYYNELPHEQPLVTVVIKAEGKQEQLDRTIATIVNQTYENIEVVVAKNDEPEQDLEARIHGEYEVSVEEGTLLFADAVECMLVFDQKKRLKSNSSAV